MFYNSSSLYLCHTHRIENLHIFYRKKFTEIQIMPQWAQGMISCTSSTYFFTHLNSLSHSSLPAEPSKNSTEGWNEFFHFPASGCPAARQERAPGSSYSCTARPAWAFRSWQLQLPGPGQHSQK